MTSLVYNLESDILTGLDPLNGNNTVTAVQAGLSYPAAYTVQWLKADGTPCDNLVGTGCTLNLLYEGVVRKTYQVILYGDTNGDGRVNSTDLNAMFEHVLRRKPLEGLPVSASDVDHNGKINSTDLNLAFAHVLRKSVIKQ